MQIENKNFVIIELITQSHPQNQATVQSDYSQSHVRDLADTLATDLVNSKSGDLVFEIHGNNTELKRLYAWKNILMAKSQYFSTSKMLRQTHS